MLVLALDVNKGRILMFKDISKVRLLLPLNVKGISKILEIKHLTFEENPLKLKGFSKVT